MKKIAFYCFLPIIYLIALLPFPVLYLLSAALNFILFGIFQYRKQVIIGNLTRSFPNHSPAEIHAIYKKYCQYFADLTLETFKTLTISKQAMQRRCAITPQAQKLFNNFADRKQSIILVLGHWGNWEWGGNAFSLACRHQLYVIYHPLTNPHFDKLMYNMRSRFGTKLIAMNNTYKDMVRVKNELNATAFIADQTPSTHNTHWTTFLHQDTPVFKGTEIIARKLNLPIVYISIKKVKRGYYTLDAEILVENPQNTSDGEITNMHTHRLEKDINAMPEIWLWSHRRWKHKRNNDVEGV
ncbi:MAG: lipid A biosynthesis acyltransferase [Chitinophagia bacterium]|nr:lipid A biosynthesis acyltransferase [Chitinophagia bacterium]